MTHRSSSVKKKREPLPRLLVGDALRTVGNYGFSEAAFEPIPEDHPLIRRHRVVERFRSGKSATGRPPFQFSTVPEEHLKPSYKRALRCTNSCFNGVDVGVTYFPDHVTNSAFLRVPAIKQRPLWDGNQKKAQHSHRYNFQCPALDEEEPPLSYLATKIVEDGAECLKLLQRGWCGQTDIGNTFSELAKREPNYLETNKKKKVMKQALVSYRDPLTNARIANHEERIKKKLQRVANEESLMMLHYRPDAPKVFKISNIDDWWGLNPVAVASEQILLKDKLASNPFRLSVSDLPLSREEGEKQC